jgi:hypothetical protein
MVDMITGTIPDIAQLFDQIPGLDIQLMTEHARRHDLRKFHR